MPTPVLLQLAICVLVSFLISCSSIKKKAVDIYLEGLKDKKAEKAHYLAPPSPYQKQKHPDLDAFWWNPETKSSISYFSSCSKIQKTLKKFQEEALPPKVILLKSVKEKNSLYTLLEIPHLEKKTYSAVYTLKAENCYFNINLVTASHASFQKEEPVLKTFINNFKAR